MIYLAQIQCPNGHNILTYPFESPHAPAAQECTARGRGLSDVLKRQIEAGKTPGYCPFCGTPASEYDFLIGPAREDVQQMSLDQVNAEMLISEKKNAPAVKAAMRRRVN